ncbi:unnamed protein product [Auanema sp. JU1783]|nr:unnamed protein product [Auanema sp. JU1783]
MVQSANRKPHWIEAASSAFAVASALPVTMNSMQIADLFEKMENGIFEQVPLNSDITSIKNSTGETLLIVAARVNNISAVKHLAQDNDIIDETDNEGWSALLNAAHKGYSDIVNVLLENGASVDLPDLMGWSPLMWAVYKNQPEVVAVLLKYRAHVNLIDEEDGLTPLIVASGRGFTNIVEKLLQHDAQVNACDKFGSTALIWASRKGHLPIVQLLLNAGGEVDAVGMYSSTALMLATRGNYNGVVDLLLTREPNINVVDQNGLSALGIAAREGYISICESLVNAGAFVNQCDRFGNWIITSAVRSGSIPIVKMLLDRFADVNCKDSEMRTPLHLAIDKSFVDMVNMILERKPNLEIKNKDGETPLIRAVKSRHVALVMILRRAGSKLSPADINGDNALHLALRARSRRLAQALLENAPVSEKRLLYRPNNVGQTAYSIDMENPQPILPLLYGPKQADQQMDSMMGYDIYSNVIADIVCEPSLSLPLTIGLYAKWGSGKSILLSKLKDAMIAFSRRWTEGARLRLSFLFIFYAMFSCIILTSTVATFVAISGSLAWYIAVWVIGLTLGLSVVIIYALLWYGSEHKPYPRATSAASKVAKAFSHVRLLWNVFTLHAPLQEECDVSSNPVSFLFADYHRLSSIGGEQALTKIITTLMEAAEQHYGILPVRMFTAIRRTKAGQHGSIRRILGFPLILLAGFTFIILIIGESFLSYWLFSYKDNTDTIYLTLGIAFLALYGAICLYPISLIIRYGWTNIPRRRVNRSAQVVSTLKLEGLMQNLQNEVDLLAEMVRSLDAFTQSQTRLVVIVDGLDNCEQERMVQTLDAIELLFSARQDRPIISIIAVDPHIIISAINHNMQSALAGTELTGYDYLKNIINMPFFLHNTALRQLQRTLKEKRESYANWMERFRRQETFHGSHLSLREADGRQSRKQTVVNPGRNIGETLTDDYFSNMNPRSIRRIVNSLTLSGRLMRAFEIEFSWLSLGHWISLLEQWPARMCWLIDRALDISNNTVTLAEIYLQLKDTIPKKDTLIEIDRNSNNFEVFLTSVAIPSSEQLTVGHIKKFVPCTSNLDPYLRKLIRDKRQGQVDPIGDMGFGLLVLPPNAQHLFRDENTWSTVNCPLVQMTVGEVCALLKQLDISKGRLDRIVSKFHDLNLSGLVLATCNLTDVREALNITLGDWTMIRLLIETLKAFGANVPGIKTERNTLTLREEDEGEDQDDFNDITPKATMTSSSNLAAEQKRRSLEVTDNEQLSVAHNWLIENWSGMDLVETEGDIDNDQCSNAPSVRFDCNDHAEEASDADSTESRLGSSRRGSTDKLLEPPSVPLSRHSSTNGSMVRVRSSYRNTSRYRKLSRSELMAGIHNDSIHSMAEGVSSRSSLLSDDDDHQQTVMRRDKEDKDRALEQLKTLFNQSNESGRTSQNN